MTVGCPTPAGTSATQPLYLRLRECSGGEARITLRARRPQFLLQGSVFYIGQRNWTDETSAILLPKQGLHNDYMS